jgi:hypothetical protein
MGKKRTKKTGRKRGYEKPELVRLSKGENLAFGHCDPFGDSDTGH